MPNPVKISAVVEEIENHGDGIYTITFKPQRRLPRFDSGQFMHLAIDDYNPRGGFWPESRVFSIASSRHDANIVINYSVKGTFTQRMSTELTVGRPVWLKLPYGEFVINKFADSSRAVILLAGGTGISPYLSYLSDLFQEQASKHIHLIYGVRKQNHIIQEELLGKCLNEIDGFSMDLFVEETDGTNLSFPGNQIHKGMINTDLIREIGQRYSDPLYFISGPPQMIRFFKNVLLEEGLSESSIKIDEWG